jgi:oxygen-dependent protoporphyrinogen oxidase
VVIVLEASDRVGGKLRLAEVAGVPVDVGAEAVLARRPEAVGLIRAAGLGEALIAPTTTAANVRVGGGLHPLPARTFLGIPADVAAARASGALSDGALARIASEPDAEPLPPLSGDVSVGELVRSRLGNEVVDRLVEPLLGGVYAGRADRLSLRATMAPLASVLARSGGSLVRAAASVTDVGTHDASAGPVFASLRGGLGSLPQALATHPRVTVRTRTTARDVRRATDGGFTVVCGSVPQTETLESDAVIVAAPAAKSAALLASLAPAAALELRDVETASMAIVTLAFRDAVLPQGSGVLVGAREGFQVKAVTLSSQKWPMRTDLVILRASIGRIGEVQALQREDAELLAAVRHELRTLIGVDAEPVDSDVTRWGGALPQYGVGHVERVGRIRAAIQAVPGLAVCGATYDGVGIPACIASAQTAARTVAEHLSVPQRGE